MKEKIKIKDFVRMVQAELQYRYTQKELREIIQAIFNVIKREIKMENVVYIPKFGRFRHFFIRTLRGAGHSIKFKCSSSAKWQE